MADFGAGDRLRRGSRSSLERVRRGDFNFVGDVGRNVAGGHGAIGVVTDADDSDHAAGDFDGWGGVEFSESEKVAQRFGFFFHDQQVDFDFVLEAKRGFEIAFGVDARPADGRIGFIHGHGKYEGAEETVLGGFHEAKEIREVHDARHVGLGNSTRRTALNS